MAKAKYDTAQHRHLRKHWAPIVASGMAHCAEAVCLMPTRAIHPGSPWDLAHAPGDHGYLGPAHARCNRSEGAARGNKQRGEPFLIKRWSL